MQYKKKTNITANRYGKKEGYRTKAKRQITEIHIARAEHDLSCTNCIYANFCAAQPTLREYLAGVHEKDMSALVHNQYWKLF